MTSLATRSTASASPNSFVTLSLAPGRVGLMKHRLVYLIEGDDVVILQARYHYG